MCGAEVYLWDIVFVNIMHKCRIPSQTHYNMIHHYRLVKPRPLDMTFQLQHDSSWKMVNSKSNFQIIPQSHCHRKTMLSLAPLTRKPWQVFFLAPSFLDIALFYATLCKKEEKFFNTLNITSTCG